MSTNTLLVFFAEYFPYLVAAVFVILALWPRAASIGWRFLIEGLLAGFFARGGVELIRLFVHRPRPFIADSSIIPLISESSYSFPSGHAAFFFALAAVVYLHNRRAGIWFFAAAAAIGLARVLAGVHYISDILGGALLGLAVGYGVWRFTKK